MEISDRLFSYFGQEEVEIEAKVVGKKGRLSSVVVEIRRKSNGELIALGKQWMSPATIIPTHLSKIWFQTKSLCKYFSQKFVFDTLKFPRHGNTTVPKFDPTLYVWRVIEKARQTLVLFLEWFTYEKENQKFSFKTNKACGKKPETWNLHLPLFRVPSGAELREHGGNAKAHCSYRHWYAGFSTSSLFFFLFLFQSSLGLSP